MCMKNQIFKYIYLFIAIDHFLIVIKTDLFLYIVNTDRLGLDWVTRHSLGFIYLPSSDLAFQFCSLINTPATYLPCSVCMYVVRK